jgi:hypothetical protein
MCGGSKVVAGAQCPVCHGSGHRTRSGEEAEQVDRFRARIDGDGRYAPADPIVDRGQRA